MKPCDENCFECAFDDCIMSGKRTCKTDVDRSFTEGEHKRRIQCDTFTTTGPNPNGQRNWTA